MIRITNTAIGSIATAQNDQFSWFWGAPGYVTEIATGRSIYLPVGGYTKATDFGCDPAPADVVAAARAFVVEIAAMEQDAADIAAKQTEKDMDDAAAVLMAIPAQAKHELQAINAEMARRAETTNEGGDGYIPQLTWASTVGRNIAAKHGLDIGMILAASNTLCK
ncbi:MAG TPA: hypothetical protein DEF16_02100 [Gemmobacter sp.]|nr:hypothetical protein [Gemmobacter sp.]HBU13773.1 hypothetical protein [Gemmobacter sp.]